MNIEKAKDLIAFCYLLVVENYTDLFLNNYEDNSNIHLERIQEYSDKYKCSRHFSELLKHIYSQCRYISKREIIDIIEKNVVELFELLKKNPDYLPIIIITKSQINKSNLFFTLYFLKRFYENYRIRFPYAFNTVNDIFSNMIIETHTGSTFGTFKNITLRDEYKDVFRGKTLILILTDDFLYSGKQLAGHLVRGSGAPLTKMDNPMKKNKYDGKMSFNTAVKFFINIIGLTDNANNLIRNEFDYPDNHLILPKAIIRENIYFSDIISKLDKDYIYNHDLLILQKNHIDNNIEIKSELNYMMYQDNLTLIIPFHKYPDYISTVQFLCGIKTFNNNFIVDYKKFSDKYPIFKDQIDDLIFIEGSKLINNIDPAINEQLKTIIDTGRIPENIKWLYKCDSVIDSNMVKLIDSCDIDKTYNLFNCQDVCTSSAFYKNIIYKVHGVPLAAAPIDLGGALTDSVTPVTIDLGFENYRRSNKIFQNAYSYDEYMDRYVNKQYGGKDIYYENKQKYLKINMSL
jgi:hypothetical protein